MGGKIKKVSPMRCPTHKHALQLYVVHSSLSDIKSVAITASLFKTAKMAGDGIHVLHTALC